MGQFLLGWSLDWLALHRRIHPIQNVCQHSDSKPNLNCGKLNHTYSYSKGYNSCELFITHSIVLFNFQINSQPKFLVLESFLIQFENTNLENYMPCIHVLSYGRYHQILIPLWIVHAENRKYDPHHLNFSITTVFAAIYWFDWMQSTDKYEDITFVA